MMSVISSSITLFYYYYYRPDVSKVFVAVGFGFFLELTHEEAISFIPKKIELLKETLKQLEDTSANIEAHIRTMLANLADLQILSVGTR